MSVQWLAMLATLASALFAGAALYVNLVEHPARLACGPTLAITVFGPSYRRATVMQAGLAMFASALALVVWAVRSQGLWLAAALTLFAVVPFTLTVIMPTNQKLLARCADDDPAETRALLTRWGRLHAVRSVASLIATALMLYALQDRSAL